MAMRGSDHKRHGVRWSTAFFAALAFATHVAAGTASAAGCPNEALRTESGSSYLPECRAYEQVTPTYKEGYELGPLAFARNGNAAILESLAALEGNAGDGENLRGGVYSDVRSSAGWRISPLNPPVAAYPGQLLKAANADSGQSLWVLHKPTQSSFERDLYVRSGSGDWQPIGPLFSPFEVGGRPATTTETRFLTEPVAATADYTHVLINTGSEFDIAGKRERWAFDETLGSGASLYEYAGTGNEAPTLVAVKGPKGSTELVARCGVVLGSTNLGLGGSAFNAFSADGETVFFTPLPEDLGEGRCAAPKAEEPAVAEVYARVGGAATSAREAETIDVSAPSATECSGACATSTPADKLFVGASEDGSKVFFESTQALITGATEDTTEEDGALGGEGHNGCAETTGPGGCNLYEYDLATHHLSLVAGGAEVLGVARISADGSHVYFVARGALGEVGPGGDKAQLAPEPGEPNLYVFETGTGRTKFIATLNPGPDSGDWKQQDQHNVQASPGEGRFLLFNSTGVELTTDDHNPRPQLFEYDSLTGELVRVSKGEVVAGEAAEVAEGKKGELGYNENGNTVNGGVTEALGAATVFSTNEQFRHPEGGSLTVVSTDGRTVAFASRGRLSPRAISAEANCANVYVYRVAGNEEGIASGRVGLISDGADVQQRKLPGCSGAGFSGMSASGSDILISTADPLLASDTDGLQRDVYDARIDGGVPQPALAGECALEACHGPLSVSAALASPRSDSQLAGENAAPQPPGPQPLMLTILSRSRAGGTVHVKISVRAAGSATISGPGLKTARRKLASAGTYTLTIALSPQAKATLKRRHKLKLSLSVVVSTKQGGRYSAKTSLTVKG